MFRDAGLVLEGHDPAFFLLLVVSCCNSKLRQLNKYSVCFISCNLGLLLNNVSNFVLCCDRFKTHCKGWIAVFCMFGQGESLGLPKTW